MYDLGIIDYNNYFNIIKLKSLYGKYLFKLKICAELCINFGNTINIYGLLMVYYNKNE